MKRPLPFGTLSHIARMVNVNIHTVRLWHKAGRPENTRLPLWKQRQLLRLLAQAVKDAYPSETDETQST